MFLTIKLMLNLTVLNRTDYLHKMDLALNNLQRLICHKTQQTKPNLPGLLYFTLDPYLIMLSVKQGSIKYHFLSVLYDSTWDWTQVSWTIGKHSTHYANGPVYLGIMTMKGYLVFQEMVNFSNTINHLATQMNNKTSFKQHNKERFIIIAGVKEWEWESIPLVSLVSMLVLGL